MILYFFPQDRKDMQYAVTLPAFQQNEERIIFLPHAIKAIYELLEQEALDYIGTRLHAGRYV